MRFVMETVREVERQPVLLRRPRKAPEQPESSILYSQPSLPPSIQGLDSIPSFFSHPLYFPFSSQPPLPTDKRREMKAGKGALCLSLSLPAYFIGFILVVWLCLSLSYYFCCYPRGTRYPVPTCTNAVPMHTQWRICMFSPCAGFPPPPRLRLYYGRIPWEEFE